MARQPITLNLVHKWAGLAAALWLAVLAVTGMMQLNRAQWSWQWSSGPAFGESIAEHDDKQLWRHNQVNPGNPAVRVMSGAAGAFLTRDGGRTWTRLPFGHEVVRNVSALEATGAGPGWTVRAGTDDGVWRLDLAGSRFVPEGLQGQSVNSLGIGVNRLVAAVDSSRLYERPLGDEQAAWRKLTLGALPAGASPVDLGRFLQDIHLGRGLFGGVVDWLVWNTIAVGLFVLCLTGASYWVVMRWSNGMRRRPKDQRAAPEVMRRAQKVVRWSFRIHAMIVGIVLAIPLLIVFLTGIYQDHRTDVQTAFRKIDVPAWILTPTYRSGGWRGQALNVALTQDGTGELLALGNRRGVFISRDLGTSWARDDGFKGPAMRLRNIGGQLYVPGRMVRRVQVRKDGHWQILAVPRPVVMVNEMSAGPKGTIWWTRGDTIFRTTMDGKMRGKAANSVPRLGYLPWASLAAELHRGTLISEQWKWVNDLVAVLGVLLVVTGFLRWRRRSW